MTDERRIVDLKPEPSEEGEIRYDLPKKPAPPPAWRAFALRATGIAVGVAFFLLILTLFVYVVLPIVAVLIVLAFLRRLFRPR